ncbi:MAG: hypothetical protein Q8Q26_16260 [Pseudorhodobacter sp.]|nr:hypothetical protein [Pseudorhodobacter sp.]
MTKATRDEYERMVQLAEAGIAAYKHRAKLREKPTVEALVQAMREKVARGEVVTDAEMGALAERWADHVTGGAGQVVHLAGAR